MPASTSAERRAIQFRNQCLDRKSTDLLGFIRKLDTYSTAPTSHLGLIARIKGYKVAYLDRLVAERAIVGVGALRGSGYYVPVELIPVVFGVTRARDERRIKDIIKAYIPAKTYEPLARRVEKIMPGKAMSTAEIRKELRLTGDKAAALRWAIALMTYEARIIRAEIRGSWRSNQGAYRLWDEWLPGVDPHALDSGEAATQLAELYFDAHGPATLEDFRWWSGLGPAAKTAVENADVPLIADGLLGRSKRAAPPKGVRLLPYWDGLFLTHRDRSAWIPDALYGRVYDDSGNPAPVVLVDGVAKGVWTMTEEKKRLVVRAAPFKSFSSVVWKKIEAEAETIATAVGAADATVERRSNPPSIAGGPRNLFMSPLR